MGKDTALGQGGFTDELHDLVIVSDRKLEESWRDSSLVVCIISKGVAGGKGLCGSLSRVALPASSSVSAITYSRTAAMTRSVLHPVIDRSRGRLTDKDTSIHGDSLGVSTSH